MKCKIILGCQINIQFLCEMDIISSTQYQLNIPTAIFPRYGKSQHDLTFTSSTTPGGYNLIVDISGEMQSNVCSVSTSNEKLTGSWLYGTWRVIGEIIPTKDIIINVNILEEYKDTEFNIILEKIRPSLEKGMWTFAAAITVVPRIDNNNQTVTNAEYIFLVDCSGSMETKMDIVNTGLGLFIRGLRSADTFNVVRFGNGFESLFPTSQPYNETNFKAADAYVSNMTANLGGTELLEVVEHLAQKREQSHPRIIFLLTDGHVSNTEKVIEAARRSKVTTTFFTIGVGDGASIALVDGV